MSPCPTISNTGNIQYLGRRCNYFAGTPPTSRRHPAASIARRLNGRSPILPVFAPGEQKNVLCPPTILRPLTGSWTHGLLAAKHRFWAPFPIFFRALPLQRLSRQREL